MAETVGRQELLLEMFVAGRMRISKQGTYQSAVWRMPLLTLADRDGGACLSVLF
jgi:hypothetical protein